MSELERLRADLEVLDKIRDRYDKDADFTTLVNNMRDRLESEADPWREAKDKIEDWRTRDNAVVAVHLKKVVEFFDHLTAELAAKDKRIAELEDVASDVTSLLETTDEAIDPSTDTYVACVIANAAISESAKLKTSGKPHDRITMQRRIKMQRRELRRLNGKMYDHAFERHRLKSRIAELEDAKTATNMVPPFEGPIVGMEPVLDPARVLATAAEVYAKERNVRYNDRCRSVFDEIKNVASGAKPYRLKGANDGN